MERVRKYVLYLCVFYLALVGLSALLAPVVSPYDPTAQHLDSRLAKPGEGPFPFGTDDLGRDVLSRILYGSRSVFLVGTITVSVSLTIGTLIGILSGLGNRFLDNLLMFFVDSLLSFPTILLALTIVTFLGYGLSQVMLALGIIFSPVFARIVRVETMALKHEGYVEAAHTLGTRWPKIIAHHLLPNIAGKLIVQSAVVFASSIVVESSLSYLGLGIQPPNPSWGLMLKDARNHILTSPYLAVYPGLFLALTVLSFTMIGDYLSEKTNPRLG